MIKMKASDFGFGDNERLAPEMYSPIFNMAALNTGNLRTAMGNPTAQFEERVGQPIRAAREEYVGQIVRAAREQDIWNTYTYETYMEHMNRLDNYRYPVDTFQAPLIIGRQGVRINNEED